MQTDYHMESICSWSQLLRSRHNLDESATSDTNALLGIGKGTFASSMSRSSSFRQSAFTVPPLVDKGPQFTQYRYDREHKKFRQSHPIQK
jgi:hypothetical protein